jgi:hypothetical protein
VIEDSLLPTQPEEVSFEVSGSNLQEVYYTVIKLGFDIIDVLNEDLYYRFIVKPDIELLITASDKIKQYGFFIDDKDLIIQKG